MIPSKSCGHGNISASDPPPRLTLGLVELTLLLPVMLALFGLSRVSKQTA